MSFGPPRKASKPSNEILRKSSSPNFASGFSLPVQSPEINRNIDGDYENRINTLESNLSKISNQQDALLPLMNALDFVPSLSRNENMLKTLAKKNQETEERMMRIEHLAKVYQQSVEGTAVKLNAMPKIIHVDTSLVEKNIKDVSDQVNRQGHSIKEIEANFGSIQRSIETQVSETITGSSRTMELRLEKQRNDFNGALNDLSKNIDLTFKKFEDAVRDLYVQADNFDQFTKENNKKRNLDDISEFISLKFQEQFDFFNEKYDRDIDNLYREFGILRSEMDLINQEKRQAKINHHLSSLPKEATPSEKKIKYNTAEQSLNIHDLDAFNKKTTQRIMYELQSFDEKLDQLRMKFEKNKIRVHSEDQESKQVEEMEQFRKDMEIINDRYTSLKYQVEGVKKKFFFDMRKIEDKMEKLNQIKKEAQSEMIADPKIKKLVVSEFAIIDSFPEKIKILMEAINKNLESIFTRLEIIEEKIKENEQFSRAYQTTS